MIKYVRSGLMLCLFALFVSFALTSCHNGGATVEPETTHFETVTVHTHEGGEWIVVKEATPKESGKKQQVCSWCDAVLNEEEIPAVTVELLPGITDEKQDPLRPAYQLANCRKLAGSPVVVLIFIDDNESYWQKDEVLSFTEENILVALNYLERNAKRWGVELDFVIESYATPFSGYEIKYEGTVNPDLFNGGSTKDVLDHAAADMGCESNWGLYSYYKSKYPNDDIIFLACLNKPGRSYTRNAGSAGYLAYSEHCVLFSDRTTDSSTVNRKGTQASVIAHELLHLFGAEDYYVSNSREALANRKYPHDIMLWQYDRIQENTLGDCTAFSVGWTDEVPEVCYDARWWQ